MVLDAQVQELARRIVESSIWTHPIPVCARSGLVMDGNHRLKAAKSLGLRRVPVVPLSYASQRVKCPSHPSPSACSSQRLTVRDQV
jgi:ParB-like chromosome segregation protein Spo0J